MVPFSDLADTLDRAATTRGRNDRARILAGLLRRLGPDELAPAVNLMLGRGPGVKTGVSWASLAAAARAAFGDAPSEPTRTDGYVDAGEWIRRRAPDREPTLTVLDAHNAFHAIAAARGSKAKIGLLTNLLEQASPAEAAWLARNATGEMRAGAQEGILLEAIADAADRPADHVRRALISAGDVAAVAAAALSGDPAALDALDLTIGRAIPPMLADSSADVADALMRLGGRAAFEWKLDGARIQIHRRGDEVRLWSRRMTDVTARLSDVVAHARRELTQSEAIVEGEVIVFGAGERPIAFQDVMSRWLRSTNADAAAAESPAVVFLFDCLYADGRPVIDEPYEARWRALERVRGDLPIVERLVTDDPVAARRFYDAAIDAGHEGVMAKALDAPYVPGRRGSNWLKVKAETTLDLAVIGADWGTGRRHRWLSNYHLACRDEATGQLLSVGETFKGLTDAEFATMTERLLALKLSQEGGYVAVRPDVVVEVKFNGVQRSARLPSGIALRFARITAIRDDKPVSQTDTLAKLQSMLPA